MKAISVTGIDACAATSSKKPLRARYCSEMLVFRFKKAPAGTLLLRNAIFQVQKGPCGHVTAQKCHFLGTKKASAGMSLLRNVIF